jgi:hypothetical protein
LAEEREVGEGLVLGEAGAEGGAALVAAVGVEVAEKEGGFVGGEVEVGEEEGVVGDLAEGVVGDFAFPVLGRARDDALIEHGEAGFELGEERLFEEIEHERASLNVWSCEEGAAGGRRGIFC